MLSMNAKITLYQDLLMVLNVLLFIYNCDKKKKLKTSVACSKKIWLEKWESKLQLL